MKLRGTSLVAVLALSLACSSNNGNGSITVTDGGADAAAERFEYEYSGHYEVDAERGVIAHRILSSSFPDDIGTTAYRSFQRTGAFLSVAFPVISAGEEPNRNCSYGFISLQREES